MFVLLDVNVSTLLHCIAVVPVAPSFIMCSLEISAGIFSYDVLFGGWVLVSHAKPIFPGWWVVASYCIASSPRRNIYSTAQISKDCLLYGSTKLFEEAEPHVKTCAQR